MAPVAPTTWGNDSIEARTSLQPVNEGGLARSGEAPSPASLAGATSM